MGETPGTSTPTDGSASLLSGAAGEEASATDVVLDAERGDGAVVDAACRSLVLLSGGTSVSLDDVLGVEARGDGAEVVVHTCARRRRRGCPGGGAKPARRALCRAVAGFASGSRAAAFAASANAAAAGPAGRVRRVAVLVNPASGSGKAEALWAQAKQVLEAAGVRCDVTSTRGRGHAVELAKAMDLDGIDALVVVSGDGLLTEALTGMLGRADGRTVPLAVVPAGSGNAVAKSVLTQAGERCDAVSAAWAIATGAARPVDRIAFEQAGVQLHGLLSLSWGLVADIDIESEWLRCLGGERFTAQAVLRVMRPRKYDGRLHYLPDDGDDWRVLEGPFDGIWAVNMPWGTEDVLAAPDAQLNDGCLDIVAMRTRGRGQLLAGLLGLEDGTWVRKPGATYLKARALRLEPGPAICGPKGGGYLVGDGEILGSFPSTGRTDDPFTYGPVSVSVTQGGARLLMPPASDAA